MVEFQRQPTYPRSLLSSIAVSDQTRLTAVATNFTDGTRSVTSLLRFLFYSPVLIANK